MGNTAEFTVDEIDAATGAELIHPPGPPVESSGLSRDRSSDGSHTTPSCRGVSTDTRTIQPGNLYVPLKGPNFDGNNFIGEAISKGAWGILTEIDTPLGTIPADRQGSRNSRSILSGPPMYANSIHTVFMVGSTLKALGDLAAFHRRRFKIPVVAITGSSGKTTTKELLATIASTRFKVLKTEANYNNEIGLPLMLLALEPQHDMAILELGLQKPGEIKPLAMMAKPTIGIITNIGPAHKEYFESVRDIALSKSDLFSALDPQDFAILNADDGFFGLLLRRAEGSNIITTAIDHPADLMAEDIHLEADRSSFRLGPDQGFPTQSHHAIRFEIPLPGRHIIANTLLAIAAGRLLKIEDQQMAQALSTFRNLPKRMEIVELNGIRILNDSYNANPDSMRAALEVLALQKPTGAGRRIAILGDMLELGDSSVEEHKAIGQYLVHSKIDVVVTIGTLAASIADGTQNHFAGELYRFESKEEAIPHLKKEIKPGDAVLLKGSRGMKLEELLAIF